MKKILLSILVVVVSACTASHRYANAPGVKATEDAINNEFIVIGDRSVIETELNAMGINANIDSFNKTLDIHHVTYSGDTHYGEIALRLAPKVEAIEQNSKVELHAVEKKVDWSHDRYFFYQWASNNFGQSAPWGLPGDYDADMKTLEALKKFKGNLQEDVVVAVIDSGVNYKHEDLNANMWVNKAESTKEGGIPGEDDDGNGYVDDVHGYDFTSQDRMSPHYGRIGDPDPMDESGHGTHCAGTIAALTDNGVGISGINPRAKIMALRALGSMGGKASDIIKAITYAIENNADIISASYGGSNEDMITKAVIKQAGEAGILFVAASGNNGQTMEIEGNRFYPAGYQLPNLLTVGASDNKDNPATFSNYGHNFVDVFAPGVGVLSLYLGDGYTIMDGTSMAAPMVTGLASLIMAAYPDLKKNPSRVKEIIMSTVDRKASMYGKVRSNGRVNALKALEWAQTATAQSPLIWSQRPYSLEQKGFNTELVDIRHTVEQKGAKALRLHFNFLEIDRAFDSIYIYDKNFKLVAEITNGSSRDLWSPVIHGDKAIVRFVNAKVKKQVSQVEVVMPQNQQDDCLKQGGSVKGPVAQPDPTQPVSQFICLQENIEYRYEDLSKDSEDNDVFFSWQSEGFSIDRIEYTETSI